MALSTSLVAWWKLDEESGTRVDSVGSNDLADNNTVLYGAGKVGNAADFEKDTSEYLSIADNADLSTGDMDFTIAAWVKLETLPGVLSYMEILSKDAAADNREWRLEVANDNKPYFYAMDSGGGHVGLAGWGSALSTATWYLIIGWHDATADKVYIQVNNGTPVEVAYTFGAADTTAPVCMGRLEATASGYMDGLVDEVGFWKKVLTAAERKRLYNGGAGITYPFSWETLAGAVTPVGTFAKGWLKAIAGILTPVGAYIRGIGKPVGGTVTPAGTIERLVAWYRSLAGTVTPAGTVIKGLAESLIGEMFFDISGVIYPHITGTLTKGIGKAFAGVITPAGRLLQRIANFFRIWFDGSPETVARIDITATADIQLDDSPEATVILER